MRANPYNPGSDSIDPSKYNLQLWVFNCAGEVAVASITANFNFNHPESKGGGESDVTASAKVIGLESFMTAIAPDTNFERVQTLVCKKK
jgi:hypothetical protein